MNRAQRRAQNRVAFKAKTTDETTKKPAKRADTHVAPGGVHTHVRQTTNEIGTWAELLRREPTLCATSQDQRAFAMSDYCTQARTIMEKVIKLLESISEDVSAPMAQLTAAEETALKQKRAQWMEHLRGNFYGLVAPPPASGGATARYSLAVQLWLLVAHANVILQLGLPDDADLFTFYPPASAYLSRNALVVDVSRVMSYPMRTILLALEHFVSTLDTLDRFHKDYTLYMGALEHRISDLLCHTGTRDEYNAPEWCVPAENMKNYERVSEEFIVYTMCWVLTLYNYAEGWCACNVAQIVDRATRIVSIVPVRQPAHEVANSDWAPSARSMRRLTAFVCEYAHGLKAGEYTRAMRLFLLQFDLRPGDVDIYRVMIKTNQAHIRSVLQYEFRGASVVARAYLRKLHHDRSVYTYVAETLQWTDGNPMNTRSSSLPHLGFTRQLAVLNVLHQFIEGKFHIPFRERFMIFHRDPQMINALIKARQLGYPVIVQQFARFSVFVPHRRPPQEEIATLLRWRADTRARRKHLPSPAPAPAPVAPQAGVDIGEFRRFYDCTSALDAFAIWALWLLQLTNGRIDNNTDMRDFLLDLFGWR